MLHDTYFVVGHFHIVMGLCCYIWYAGRSLPLVSLSNVWQDAEQETFRICIHFWLTLRICILGTFFPMHLYGISRFTASILQPFTLLPEYGVWCDVNVVMTMAAIMGGIAQLIFIYNFFTSIFLGKSNSKSLEVKYTRMDYSCRAYAR